MLGMDQRGNMTTDGSQIKKASEEKVFLRLIYGNRKWLVSRTCLLVGEHPRWQTLNMANQYSVPF